MLKSNTVQRIINHSIFARFKICPRPQSLTHSLAIYDRLDQVAKQHNADIMSYSPTICPVTKERLETLRVIFHDPSRPVELKNVQEKVFEEGTLNSLFSQDPELLSGLEKALLDNTNATHHNITTDENKNSSMKFELEFLSRDPSDVTRSRDLRTINALDSVQRHGNKPDAPIDVKASVNKADDKYLQEMQKFLDIFQ